MLDPLLSRFNYVHKITFMMETLHPSLQMIRKGCNFGKTDLKEGCSQNAEKATHIKGRLLDQAVVLFNCAPFLNGNFSLRKKFAPRGSKFFPLRAVPYGI